MSKDEMHWENTARGVLTAWWCPLLVCALKPPRASLVAQRLKRLPAMQETWVRSLGQEDPWKRKWQPTPVFLRGESHGQRSLVGYSPRGRKESDTTEWLHFHSWPLSTQMARGNALHLGKFPRLHHFSHSTTSPTGFILLGIHFGTGTLNSPLNIGFAF